MNLFSQSEARKLKTVKYYMMSQICSDKTSVSLDDADSVASIVFTYREKLS